MIMYSSQARGSVFFIPDSHQERHNNRSYGFKSDSNYNWQNMEHTHMLANRWIV